MTSLTQSSTKMNAVTTHPGKVPHALKAWRRRLLITIVIVYVALLILAPLAALISGAFSKGIGTSLATRNDAVVLTAFLRTLYIALFV